MTKVSKRLEQGQGRIYHIINNPCNSWPIQFKTNSLKAAKSLIVYSSNHQECTDGEVYTGEEVRAVHHTMLAEYYVIQNNLGETNTTSLFHSLAIQC